jgi:hypothetical protein
MSDNHVRLSQVIAHALTNADFKKALIADPAKALASQGLTFPAGHSFVLHQEDLTHKVVAVPHNPIPEAQRLTVLPRNPTAYQMALWAITEIQSNGPLAATLLQNPVNVLRNQGAHIPQSLHVSVVRNTESTTHIVLPYQGTKELAGEELNDEMLDQVAGGKKKSSVLTSTNVVTAAEAVTTVVAAAEGAVAAVAVAVAS